MNTKRWEFEATVSGDWILFGRVWSSLPSNSQVILHNTNTTETRILAERINQRHSQVQPGQVNGDPAGGTSNSAAVSVRVVTSGRLSGYYATSGKYRLYHYHSQCPRLHTSCPIYTGSVRPNHAGKRVVFTLQIHTSRGWHTAVSFSGTLGHRSRRAERLIYTGPGIEGVPTRIHTTFKSDSDHLGDTSGWSYLKITP